MDITGDASVDAPTTYHRTLPFPIDEAEWLSTALVRENFCDRHRDDEAAAGCDQPQNATADPPGSKPVHSGQKLTLKGMTDSHLVYVPPNPGAIRTLDHLHNSGLEQYAAGRRLTDLGVVFALLTTEPQWRGEHLAYDFDKRGRIRHTGLPRAPT